MGKEMGKERGKEMGKEMGKGIATAVVWLGPALACWATGESLVAWAFLFSFFATISIWD